MTSQQTPIHVVVAGAGVAGLEAVMALHELAGKRVSITLVSPDEEFVYRPLSVGEPFALGPALRLSVPRFAKEFGADLRQEAVKSVAPGAKTVLLENGDEIAYDKLLIAAGGRREAAYDHARTFRGQEDVHELRGLVQDVEEGYSRRIAFVVPPGVAWSLPLYELALMTARRAFEMNVDVEITIVTPEPQPLAVFGQEPSQDVQRLLDEAGIVIHCGASAEVPAKGTLRLHPGGMALEVDRIVALPVVRGAGIPGLPYDREGFLPIDSFTRVGGLDDVYAAGDGTNFPVKQGGIACQQADVAAEEIARAAGVPVERKPFRPVLRGQLLTGGKPHFMRHDVAGRAADWRGDASGSHMLWWPPTKVAGKYLAPYLASREKAQVPAPSGDHEIELSGLVFADR